MGPKDCPEIIKGRAMGAAFFSFWCDGSMRLRACFNSVESSSSVIFLIEHDLFGKQVPTFPDHALSVYNDFEPSLRFVYV